MGNKLKGELPQALIQFRKLKQLFLSSKRVAGSVPVLWQRMEALQELMLPRSLSQSSVVSVVLW